MYGKLENHNLIIAPKRLIVGDTQIYNAPASLYLEQGWYPIVYTDPPYDPPVDYEWESGWAMENETITQEWVLVPLDPDRDLGDAEVLNILLGGEDE